jgi:lysophospholipase L1-like esterase
MNARHLALLACAFLAALARAQTPAPDLAKNPAPVIAALNPALPTIFVAGDSTAARGQGERQQGWGVPFADYFDPAKVNVANRARGGRSSRTFIAEGSWDNILADAKAGDIILIQFSHNDGSPVNEAESVPVSARRSRGSIPGLGEETQEIDNIVTKQHEVVHTYGWYMRKMIADTKAKGAQPIVVATTVRNNWKDGHIERGPGHYRAWAYDIARDAAVPFVDLTTTMADKFESLGEEETNAIYQQDHTHFNAIGADLHAAGVVSGLKGLRLKTFNEFLSAKGAAVEADKTAWLRLPVPRDRTLPTLFLVGDSTVRNGRGDGQEKGGQWGWGDFLAPYFDTDKINVCNRAVGGTGVQTFMVAHWESALRLMKPGDFVTIQFGHNDNPPRGPLPGLGEETAEREDPRTHEKITMHTWGWYLRKYITDARAKGVTPIVCSLVPRKTWDKDGKVARSTNTFAGWARQVAASDNVAFVDLNELVAARYDALGHDEVMKLFPQVEPDEHTHTDRDGAKITAGIVATALRALPAQPFAKFLRPVTP